LNDCAETLLTRITSLKWLKLRLDRFEGGRDGWARTALLQEGIFAPDRQVNGTIKLIHRTKHRAGRQRNAAPIQRTIEGLFMDRWDLIRLVVDWKDARVAAIRGLLARMLFVAGATFVLLDLVARGLFGRGTLLERFSRPAHFMD
jgi:hypothetical protein